MLVTHFMEEAERLCDRVAVIDAGRVVALDSPGGLVARVDAEQRIRFRPSVLLDDHLLSLAQRRTPKVCFVPTASGDAEAYVERFLDSFTDLRADASVLHLFQRDPTDLRSHVLSQDIVYVENVKRTDVGGIWTGVGLWQLFRTVISGGLGL